LACEVRSAFAVRRPHHPYWAEKLEERWHLLWNKHFIHPQFDALGVEPRFVGARYLDIRGENIRAGDHFHLYATKTQPVSFAVDPFEGGDGAIDIGSYCIVAPGVRIRSAIHVEIGDDCMLAENVFITDADWHDPQHRIYPGKREPVVLEDNVWVCDGARICKGVRIGENSIIGAGAIVTRDVPKNTIAAGNPAKPIGELPEGGHTTRRRALFVGGLPYQTFKDQFDAGRLAGNTVLGYLRARWFPDSRS
jgi:acetyltransferase-like isoleucine patch superfamily enzyme